jgi:hypothetical protein
MQTMLVTVIFPVTIKQRRTELPDWIKWLKREFGLLMHTVHLPSVLLPDMGCIPANRYIDLPEREVLLLKDQGDRAI